MASTHSASESDVLNRVCVRLLHEQERPQFDRLLTEQHYLHDPVLTGQSLRYVAELDGQWVALIAFSAAALHLKAREQWVGWSHQGQSLTIDSAAKPPCFGKRRNIRTSNLSDHVEIVR